MARDFACQLVAVMTAWADHVFWVPGRPSLPEDSEGSAYNSLTFHWWRESDQLSAVMAEARGAHQGQESSAEVTVQKTEGPGFRESGAER